MINTKAPIPSTCWECSTHCGSLLEVGKGRVKKIKPNISHPSSKGAFCVKGARGLRELTYHPNRILHPMKQVGGRGSGNWEPITWDQALDEIVENFLLVRNRYGARSIVGAVSNAHFSRGVSVALLMRAFGSPNWMMNQDLCGGCRGVSDKITGLAINNGEDIDHTRCALVVGRNPAAADPVQWLALGRAKKRGASIIVIDPSRTPTAKIADLWIRPRPGTDSAIALAMINWIITNNKFDAQFVKEYTFGFEDLARRAADYSLERAANIAKISPKEIENAAKLYANGPSCFVSGHGIDAFSSGFQTFRAFHCLVAISGNLDRRGGNRRVKKPPGFTNYIEVLHKPEFRLPKHIENQTIGAEKFPLWSGPSGWQTACHNPTVIEAILSGAPYPVRALYVSGVNIAVTYPNTRRTIDAIKSLDSAIGAGHFMNPTLAQCDIVLPKTTGLEEEELSLESNGPCLSLVQPAHPPLGQARSDFDIANAIVERLEARGLEDARRVFPWRSKNSFDEYLLGDGPLTLEKLREKGFAKFDFTYGQFDRSPFRTPSGKVELFSETLKKMGLDPLPGYLPLSRDKASAKIKNAYPLVLLTGAREKTYHHSRFREQPWALRLSPDPWIQIHPETAKCFEIYDKGWVELTTAYGPGSCFLKARVTNDILPGVLRTGMGWWTPNSRRAEFGALTININAATSYDGPWDPVTGSPDSRGILCRIKKASPP
ncbi:MAG: molybdopterin-dependent oxidoreductase [Rhodospirillaceae bacterium]|jgi:thiosulfate reductase/polysulfide reductase chain A